MIQSNCRNFDPGEPDGKYLRTVVGQAPRSAFTLLETILALSLAAMLLGSIYAAIDQSWRMSASGREEMERAQLARALIHKIEVDIRAITFVPPPPEEDTETTSSSTTAAATPTPSPTPSPSPSSTRSPSPAPSTKSPAAPKSSPAAAPTAATTPASTPTASTDSSTTEPPVPNSKSIGIRGTDQKMELSIARPRRDLLPGTAAMGGSARTSDLRAVTYSFLPTGSSSVSGLVRTEGDRMAVEMIEAKGSSASQISSVQMLAPEVAAFHIRYFDGRIWSTAWDSEKSGRIPRAVEVSIAFLPPRRKPALFNAGISRSMDSFRTVVLIPVSDPYPKEFLP